jgi:hypothetical protein
MFSLRLPIARGVGLKFGFWVFGRFIRGRLVGLRCVGVCVVFHFEIRARGCTLSVEKIFQRRSAGILFAFAVLFLFLYGVSCSVFGVFA